MINLDLTEDIIKSFNSCVKSGNYMPFLTDNKRFLDDLCSGLKKVDFKRGTKFDWISQELKYSFNYLSKFDPRDPKKTVPGVRFWEKYLSEISADIKSAISERDWNSFYWKYREDADAMISEARRQEKLDFNIDSGSGIFENFKIRDESVAYYAYQEEPVTPTHYALFTNNRNNGSMIQKEPPDETNKPNISNSERNVSVGIKNETYCYHYSVGSSNPQIVSLPNHISSIEPEPEHKRAGNECGRSGIAAQSKLNSTVQSKHNLLNQREEPMQNKTTVEKSKKSVIKTVKKVIRRKKSLSPVRLNQKEVPTVNDTNLFDGILKDMAQGQKNEELPQMDRLNDIARNNEIDLKSATKNIQHKSYNFSSSQPDSLVSLRKPIPNRESPEFDNTAFDQKLHDQKVRHSRELEDMKAERKRKQKKFEEELQKMRAESKKRFEILLQCILMKHRFEEQEQYWKDWIQGCRQHIIVLVRQCGNFTEDVERSHGGFRKQGMVDREDLKNDTRRLLGNVTMAFNALQFDFENLKRVEDKKPDALFVKVLQKCLSDAANTHRSIYASIENLETSRDRFRHLQSQFDTLTPNMIYSTSELRRICNGNNFSKYDNIHFPDWPQGVLVREYDE